MYDVEPEGVSKIREALDQGKGSLVTIKDQAEQNKIYRMLSAYGEKMYAFGLKSDSWSDGGTSTYRNMGTGKGEYLLM